MLRLILRICFRLFRIIKYFILRLYDSINIYLNFSFLDRLHNKKPQNILLPNRYIITQYDYYNFLNLDSSNKKAIDHYLQHEFDLLGSGWRKVDYWIENPHKKKIKYFSGQSEEKSENIKSKICLHLGIQKNELNDYQPIDWQLDFISGYRWNEKTWYLDIPVYNLKGADIKVPWELSRFQHLPQLALQYAEDNSQEDLAKECIFQITDWVVSNPLRYGVNWRTSMEVGIRACNFLLTYELIQGSQFLSHQFISLFNHSLIQHGKHIKNNLERSPFSPSHNHYMANIVSLIFLGVCTRNRFSKRWLKFGIKEFNKAVDSQFYEDGGNFEGSAYYHRLVFEMVLYTIILISNNKQEIQKKIGEKELIPRKIIDKTYMAYLFYKQIITPDNRLYQYGDNDSGRFFKLTDESDQETQDFIINLANNYFNPKQQTEKGLSRLLIEKKVNPLPNKICENVKREYAISEQVTFFPDSKIVKYNNTKYSALIVLRPTILGHTHNDLFSFELYVNDCPFIVDGGSFCYTSNPKIRDQFRNTSNHNTLWIKNEEQNELKGIFEIIRKSVPVIHDITHNKVIVSHDGYKSQHLRAFTFEDNRLEIMDKFINESYLSLNIDPFITIDIGNQNVKMISDNYIIDLSLSGIKNIHLQKGFYSTQYGEKIENKRIVLERESLETILTFNFT
jgi:hypothetical protein